MQKSIPIERYDLSESNKSGFNSFRVITLFSMRFLVKIVAGYGNKILDVLYLT
jgi:hypothetical protein